MPFSRVIFEWRGAERVIVSLCRRMPHGLRYEEKRLEKRMAP
jgi:hypothetical protein